MRKFEIISEAQWNKDIIEECYNEQCTREEALKRWESAKKQKKAMVEKMRKALYEDYKARTGEEPLTFNVL